ncbi:MAG: helix-turn-helix domain-containing protein [Acidiferrobacter sp.]
MGTTVHPGGRLKAAREHAGWSIEQVALKLRLSVSQVTALENGEREGLPPAPYVRGYLRSYAHLLGLDAQEFAQTHVNEEPAVARVPTPVHARRKWPLAPILYFSFLAAVIAAVVLWHVHKTRRLEAVQAPTQTAQAIGALPPRLQSLATPGTSNGQLSAFPLHRRSAIGVRPFHVSPKPPVGRTSAPTRAGLRPPMALAHSVGPRPEELHHQGRHGARSVPAGAKPPRVGAPQTRSGAVVTVAPKSRAVPSPGGLISLPQGHRYIGLRISASMVPIHVSVRDANGTRLLKASILAGHSVRVVGRAPFHIVFSKTQGVAVKVGGRAVALPAPQKGQSLRVTVDP